MAVYVSREPEVVGVCFLHGFLGEDSGIRCAVVLDVAVGGSEGRCVVDVLVLMSSDVT